MCPFCSVIADRLKAGLPTPDTLTARAISRLHVTRRQQHGSPALAGRVFVMPGVAPARVSPPQRDLGPPEGGIQLLTHSQSRTFSRLHDTCRQQHGSTRFSGRVFVMPMQLDPRKRGAKATLGLWPHSRSFTVPRPSPLISAIP